MGELEGTGEEVGKSQVQVRRQREDAGLLVKMGDWGHFEAADG
jgi:hypothetical protein